jgi:hypothetical protein
MQWRKTPGEPTGQLYPSFIFLRYGIVGWLCAEPTLMRVWSVSIIKI